MDDKEMREKGKGKKKFSAWLIIGVIVLILLLFFWVDIADLLGFGDGAAAILPAFKLI